MGARYCQELGINLQKICSRLLYNDELVKLLYYADLDPLAHKPLSDDEKREKVFNDLITVVPKMKIREDNKSAIAIYIPKATRLTENSEFKNVTIAIDVFVPLTQWLIKDSNLRPFAIMGEIQKSLNGKIVNGLGKIEGGGFELVLLTDEVTGYRQTFSIVEYE
jgi:hypothetical protein